MFQISGRIKAPKLANVKGKIKKFIFQEFSDVEVVFDEVIETGWIFVSQEIYFTLTSENKVNLKLAADSIESSIKRYM